ncbi:Purine nucleoside phosphorylase [Tilletia horrida]|nr:Purine nucleoside phosphorylase [Tilletia horrida]
MAPLPPFDDLAALPPQFGAAVSAIRAAVPDPKLQAPVWGIVCGSGLSGLAASLVDKVEVPYSQIPGFAHSSVAGHGSALAFGYLVSAEQPEKRVPVVACLGRFHFYEGYAIDQVVFPVRVMRCLGVQAVVITNAAGAINPNFEVGTIVALHDHLSLPSLTASNPLIGPNLAFGPRFPPLSNAYDVPLRMALFRAAKKLNLLGPRLPGPSPTGATNPASIISNAPTASAVANSVQEGTYAWALGPTYESRAECRFFLAAGADCVGMSTVPEVIAATHAGMRVLVLSLMTNKVVVTPYFDCRGALEAEDQRQQADGQAGAGVEDVGKAVAAKEKAEAANHEEVLEVGRKRANDMRRLVETVICDTEL